MTSTAPIEHPPNASRTSALWHGTLRLAPGLALCAVAVAIALAVASVVPVLSATLMAIVLGVLTRPIAALFVCDMIGAILLAKRTGGFFAPQGWELEFLLAVASLALVVGGAGAISIDGAIAKRRF